MSRNLFFGVGVFAALVMILPACASVGENEDALASIRDRDEVIVMKVSGMT